jgi:hypothetical protein
MNGVPLPAEQGYPIRLVLPGSKGYQWVQWLDRIEINDQDPSGSGPFWFQRYPLHAKMFAPQDGDYILPGTHTISGFAFDGQGREIVSVEISMDDGVTWADGMLNNFFVPNVWKHWEYPWNVPQVGTYKIFARVKDNLGNIQKENPLYGWRRMGITVDVDYDTDNDSVPDGGDNCQGIPNGSAQGTCSPGSTNAGTPCNSQSECTGSGQNFCSLGQEDTDFDGVGDVCDNCPDNCNEEQLDHDNDEIGDVCDNAGPAGCSDGGGGCGLPACEQECLPVWPPSGHTIDNGGFFHKDGLYDPETNCTACHGAGLTGDIGPSCYSCHSDIWLEASGL